MAVFILGLSAVAARIVQLQTAPAARLAEVSPRTYSRATLAAPRGDILDRTGRVLATSEIAYRLFVDPQLVEDPQSVAVDLAELIGVDPVELDKRLQARLRSRYAPLIDVLTDAQYAVLSTINWPGVGLEPIFIRTNPQGDVGASLLGRVGFEHTGLSGIEYDRQKQLTGTPGQIRFLRDGQWRRMWIERDDFRAETPGDPVRLSIDFVIQQIAEAEIAKMADRVNASAARMVILDPATGELLAVADLIRPRPDLDEPYVLDPLRKIDPALGRNRCVTDPYEPGSTFKPFVWAEITRLGAAHPDETFNTHNGAFRTSQGRPLRDTYGYPELTWDMVLVKSSNIGMAQGAERLSFEQLRSAVTRFGFGSLTDSGLPGETAGIMTSPKNWKHYTQTSVSMGHEIAVTPMQMVRAFSAFARDGTLADLTIFARNENNPAPDSAPRALEESVAMQTRIVMHRVMKEGTGRHADADALYEMFGKSGTAQLPKRHERGYYQDRYVSSFIAAAPLDNPRIIVLCVVEDPDRRIAHLGGAVCGPVVRDVINQVLPYLGVPPHRDDAVPDPSLASR